MEKVRCRLNSAGSSFLLKSGGGYIRYPDIKGSNNLLQKDGVHLTDVGNNILLNTIQGGIEQFLVGGFATYPDQFC